MTGANNLSQFLIHIGSLTLDKYASGMCGRIEVLDGCVCVCVVEDVWCACGLVGIIFIATIDGCTLGFWVTYCTKFVFEELCC